MDFKKAFKKFITIGAIYYTAVSAVTIIIATMLADGSASKILVPKQFLFMLAFCYIMSLGSVLKHVTAYPKFVGQIIHAACYILGFMVFLILCDSKFLLVAIATLIFAICYTVVALFSNKKEKNNTSYVASAKSNNTKSVVKPSKKDKKKQEYTSQFSFNSKN